MINLKFFWQKKEYTCGPAALRMVFDFFGKKFSEEKLTKKLKSNKKIGTSHQALIQEVRKEGFYCFVHENSSLNNLKDFIEKGFPIIIHYLDLSDNVEHYSVVIGFNKKEIILNDSCNGKKFAVKISDFEKRWHSEKNNYKKKWMMVISKNKFNLGRQYDPI